MPLGYLTRILAVVFSAALLALSAQAEKRAFVVGVGEYDELSDLQKTIGDANGYSDLFGRELGYQVTGVANTKKRRDFLAAFDVFARSVAPGDEVVFVFSGHGWSDGAENYLSFSDAPRGVSEAVLRGETIALKQHVMRRLRARNPKFLLAIIDACRDENYDPLTKSSGTLEKGIVRISAFEGELILYSAAQGQTSLDRLSNSDPSNYSVFTRVLLPQLRDTSKPLSRIANDTRAKVQQLASSISHPQRPEMMMGIDLDFCLSGVCASGRSEPATSSVAEVTALTAALEAHDLETYKAFLLAYPATTSRAFVEGRINTLSVEASLLAKERERRRALEERGVVERTTEEAAEDMAAAAREAAAASEVSDRNAQPLRPVIPTYPIRALERGTEGVCDVAFDIDVRGRPFNVNAACTKLIFKREAERAVSLAEFAPTLVNGQPVEQKGVVYPLGFSIAID